MKNRPIHENLDTAFVNLSALIKYLRRRRFVGSIRVELTGYEAEVSLSAAGELCVREHDCIAGRISEGEEALQRLLIRAREPGGNIAVYQESEVQRATEEIIAAPVEEIDSPVMPERAAPLREISIAAAIAVEQISVDVIAKPPHRNGNSKTAQIKATVEDHLPKPNADLPPLPFELKNQVEDKARQTNYNAQDWQMLLNITAELLNTVDQTLAEANLEFAAAFEKARSEITNDYPFLNPSAKIFDYTNGKIIVREQINARLFAASINESLRRILEKLGRNPKFLKVYLTTVQKIILLIEKRRPLYDKFSITPQLARIIGI